MQSIGGAGASVIARAVVRDLYSGARAGRELSLMGAAMSLAPIVGPAIGGLLQATFGWQSNFLLMAIIASVIVWIIWRCCRRRCGTGAKNRLRSGSIVRGYRQLSRQSLLSRLSWNYRLHLCRTVCLDFRRFIRAARNLRLGPAVLRHWLWPVGGRISARLACSRPRS